MKPIDVGKLNKRITFQRMVDKKDGSGQTTSDWEDYKTVWATVKPFKSSEIGFMGKQKPEATHRVYTRFIDGITADMRISYHGRTFEIEGPPIDIDECHRMLEIQCKEAFEDDRY